MSVPLNPSAASATMPKKEGIGARNTRGPFPASHPVGSESCGETAAKENQKTKKTDARLVTGWQILKKGLNPLSKLKTEDKTDPQTR